MIGKYPRWPCQSVTWVLRPFNCQLYNLMLQGPTGVLSCRRLVRTQVATVREPVFLNVIKVNTNTCCNASPLRFDRCKCLYRTDMPLDFNYDRIYVIVAARSGHITSSSLNVRI